MGDKRQKLEALRADFQQKVRSGHYESAGDRKQLPCGIRSWWLFYVSGLVRQIVNGLRAVRKDAFGYDELSMTAYGMVHAAESTGVEVTFDGFDSLRPLHGKPFVAVANHMSLVETMLLPAAILSYNDLSIVAKTSLSKYPGFGKLLRSIHTIFLDRKNPREDLARVLQRGAELLEEGKTVLLFPQGMRTEVFDPRKFNSLGAKLAKRAGVPLVPFACKTDFAQLGRIRAFKDLGPIDPSRPIRFSAGPILDPATTSQADIQTACLEHIVGSLRAWGMETKEIPAKA